MTATLFQVTPHRSAAIYTAAAIIHKQGPMPREQLFARMDFGPENKRAHKLREAFETGWLRETTSGFISLTDFSKRHFERETPKEYVGQITPARYQRNVFEGQGLSKKNIPKRGGLRPESDAAPAWSVKPDGYSIKSIGGGEA